MQSCPVSAAGTNHQWLACAPENTATAGGSLDRPGDFSLGSSPNAMDLYNSAAIWWGSRVANDFFKLAILRRKWDAHWE
jgi:hypothetical protein